MVAVLSVVGPWRALVLLGILAWFAYPGILLVKRLARTEQSYFHWCFGPMWGIGLSVVGLLAMWELGGRSGVLLVVAPWPLWLLLCLPRARVELALRLPQPDRRDVVALALLVVLVPIIVGWPYAHVAEAIDGGGKAYRAYFTADFVWAMSVVAEVSKGDLPPKNPFQMGGTLHYYWLAHFLSAAEYRALGRWGLSIEQVTLTNSIGYGVAFVAFLYGFVRAFGASVLGAALACTLVFLANSFEAIDRIAAWWSDPSMVSRLSTTNLDAVTRWFYGGMPVDGLQRMLLYQPHHLCGYAMGMSALLIVSRAVDPWRAVVAITCGGLLGLSLLFSSFIAIIFGAAVAIVYAVRLVAGRRWLSVPTCAILGALPVLAAYQISKALEYIDPHADHLVNVGLNQVAATRWPYALLLSFGPPLILGVLGLAVGMRTRTRDVWPIAALMAVAFCFYFLTDVPDMQGVWVGWRAGHLIFIACAVFSGILFTAGASAPPALQIPLWSCVAVLALLAVPTVALDVYNAQDTINVASGPGFPWTLRLSGFEVEALDWLKSHTPPDVIVQPNVYERSTATWGYMPAFGERRMAGGLPIAMIPMQPYRDATDAIGREVFNTGTPADRAAAARKFRIDYLYLGPAERERHPDLVASFDSRSDLFAAVFRNKEVVIYWVVP
jgi:hypothetical protein